MDTRRLIMGLRKVSKKFIGTREGLPGMRLTDLCSEAAQRLEELSKPCWIPVAERLPKCDFGYETDALLYQMRSTGTIEAGYYGRGGKIRDSYFRDYRNASDGVDASDVIAWMPLPKPYEPVN